MKKSIFKALAATAVVGTVIAMSGVVASAAEDFGTLPENTPVVFSDLTENTVYGGKAADESVAEAAVLPGVTAYSTGSGFGIKTTKKTIDGVPYTKLMQMGKGNAKVALDATTIDVGSLEKYIGIYTSGAGTIKITHNIGTSGGEDQPAFLADANGNVTSFTTSNATAKSDSIEVKAAGKYYLLVPGNKVSFNLYALEFTPAGGSSNSIAIAPTKDGKYVFVGIDDPDDPAIGTQIDVTIQNAEGKTATLDPITAVYQSLADTSIVNPLRKPYFFAYAVENADPKYSISASAGDLSASVEITESTTAASAGTTTPQEPDPQTSTNAEGTPEGTTGELTAITPGSTFDFAGSELKSKLSELYKATTKEEEFIYDGIFGIATGTDPSSGHIRIQKDEISHLRFKVDTDSTLTVTYGNSGKLVLNPGGTPIVSGESIALTKGEYKIEQAPTSEDYKEQANADITKIEFK